MRRPAGVVLVAVVLGLCAAAALLSALLFGVTGMTFHAPVLPAGGVTTRPVPAVGTMKAVFAAFFVVFLMLAGWLSVTLVGLLQMRRWARYSVLVLGGVLAFFGVMSIFGAVMGAAVSSQMAGILPRTVPVHTMQVIYLFTGLFYAALAGVGVWWLVYFNLRSVKQAFQPDPVGWTPPNPYLGQAYGQPTVLAAAAAPAEEREAQVPALIVVLACLQFVGSLILVITAFLPIPLLLCGLILHGPAKHLTLAVLAVLNLAIGVGLLRLDNRARWAMYGVMGVGILNELLLLLPAYQAQIATYNLELISKLGLPVSPLHGAHGFHSAIVLLSMIPVLIVYGLIVWVLERYRGRFLPAQR